MVNKSIGKRIQVLRKRAGLTQDQLSERVKISSHYLSSLERGVYNIKLDLLVDILNTLGCSADEVFCDVVNHSAKVKAGRLSDEIGALPLDEQKKIYEVLDTLVRNATK